MKTFLFIWLLGSSCFAGRLYPPENIPPLPTANLDAQSYINFLAQWQTNCKKDECAIWADLIRVKLWMREKPEMACAIMQTLFTPSFKEQPLVPLLIIKEAQACSKKMDAVEKKKLVDQGIKFIKDAKPKRWLELAITESLMPLAKTYDLDLFITLSVSASKLSKVRENKQVYLKTALDIAERSKPYRIGEVRTLLHKTFPRFNPQPDDWNAVGVDALSGRDFKLAVIAFKKIIADPKTPIPAKRSTYEQLKTAYKFLGQKSQMIATAKSLWSFDQKLFLSKTPPPESPKWLLASSVSLAKLLWSEHQSAKARPVLASAEKWLNGKVAMGEIYFIRGKLDEEIKRIDSGLKWMDQAVKNAPDVASANSYLWTSSWLLYKLGRFDEAIAGFRTLKNSETETGKKIQQAYWLGRSLQAKSALPEIAAKPDQVAELHKSARSEYEQIIKDDPLNYYTLLAYREIDEPLSKIGLDAGKNKKIADIPGDSGELFEWLVGTGEYNLASQLLDDEVPFPDQPTEVSEVWETYARALHFGPIFMKVAKLPVKEKQRLLEKQPWLLFPSPFQEIVNDAANRNGLWPEFIYAIMRQESIFDPMTKSKAHAYGLMQLLPSVAEPMAKKDKRRYKNSDDLIFDLFEPAFNISWGTKLLRNYFDRFDGQPLLAAAAYNAGPDILKKWLKTKFHGDPLQFIEDIPFEETRIYVKLVLRNMVNYQRLQMNTDLSVFPEWMIEGIHPVISRPRVKIARKNK